MSITPQSPEWKTIQALSEYNTKSKDQNLSADQKPMLQIVKENGGTYLRCVSVRDISLKDRFLSFFGLGSISLGNINQFLTGGKAANAGEPRLVDKLFSKKINEINPRKLNEEKAEIILSAQQGLAKLNKKFDEHNVKAETLTTGKPTTEPSETISSPKILAKQGQMQKLHKGFAKVRTELEEKTTRIKTKFGELAKEIVKDMPATTKSEILESLKFKQEIKDNKLTLTPDFTNWEMPESAKKMLKDPRITAFKNDESNKLVSISDKRIKEEIVKEIENQLHPEIDSIKDEIDGWVDHRVNAFLTRTDETKRKKDILTNLSTKMESGKFVVDRQALSSSLTASLNSSDLAGDIIRVAGDGTGNRGTSSTNYNLKDPQLRKYMEQRLLSTFNDSVIVKAVQDEALAKMNEIRDDFKTKLKLGEPHVISKAIMHPTNESLLRHTAVGQGLSIKAPEIKKYIDKKLPDAPQQAKDLLQDSLLDDLRAHRKLTMEKCKEINKLSGEARTSAFNQLSDDELDVSFLKGADIKFEKVEIG